MTARAESSVFWPGITPAIHNTRSRCNHCNQKFLQKYIPVVQPTTPTTIQDTYRSQPSTDTDQHIIKEPHTGTSETPSTCPPVVPPIPADQPLFTQPTASDVSLTTPAQTNTPQPQPIPSEPSLLTPPPANEPSLLNPAATPIRRSSRAIRAPSRFQDFVVGNLADRF